MSLCQYAFYKEEEHYYPRLYCKTNDKWCPYTKRCQKVEKFIPIDDDVWEECDRYIMEKRKNIPNGSYFVQTSRPNRQGNLFLYVIIEEGKVEKIPSSLKELKQDYVYLKKTTNGYNVSLEPFKSENITIHVNKELTEENKEEEKRETKKRGRKKNTSSVVEVQEDE